MPVPLPSCLASGTSNELPAEHHWVCIWQRTGGVLPCLHPSWLPVPLNEGRTIWHDIQGLSLAPAGPSLYRPQPEPLPHPHPDTHYKWILPPGPYPGRSLCLPEVTGPLTAAVETDTKSGPPWILPPTLLPRFGRSQEANLGDMVVTILSVPRSPQTSINHDPPGPLGIMNNLRLREVKQVLQCHRVRKGQSRCDCRSCIFLSLTLFLLSLGSVFKSLSPLPLLLPTASGLLPLSRDPDAG